MPDTLDCGADPTPGEQRLSLSFACGGTGIRQAMETIHTHLKGWHVPAAHIDAAQIVIAEILNNVEEHAYADRPDGRVDLWLCSCPGLICGQVADQGRPLPPGPFPGDRLPPIDPNDLDGLPEGGFGWVLIRKMTRELSYARVDGENRLRFTISSD